MSRTATRAIPAIMFSIGAVLLAGLGCKNTSAARDGGSDTDSSQPFDSSEGAGGAGTGGIDPSSGVGGVGGTGGAVATGGLAGDVGSGGVGTGGDRGTGGRVGIGGAGTGGAGIGGAGIGGAGIGGAGIGGAGIGGAGIGGAGTGGAQCTAPAVNACTLGATQCASATSLVKCAVSANGCTANITSICPATLVCERFAPADCVDPTWAEWPMPNGSEDLSAPNPEAYTDNGDGTVTDGVTALMWQKEVAVGLFDWDHAFTYCSVTLNASALGGHQDWRLPSRIELVSLLDVGKLQPSINTDFFPTLPETIAFWSSSPVFGSDSSAWYVPFDFGGTYGLEKSTMNHVRCVR